MPKPEPQKKTNLAAILLQGALLLVAILVYLYLTAQIYVIACEKETSGEIQCSLRDTVMGIVTLRERTTGLAAAAVADQCDEASCKYRVELYDIEGQMLPMSEEFTSGSVVKERLAKLLNNFVIDPQRTSIVLREQLSWLVFTLPLLATGVFVLLQLNQGRPKG